MNTIAYITSKSEQYDLKDIEARKTKLNIEDLPKNLSAFSNDVGFIDKTVNDLINYYKKSEIYNKTEIDQKLATKWDSKFVDELPTEDISTSTIYFVPRPKTEQEQSDSYNEYIYDGAWELIGNTYVDLSDYYKKSEAESMADSKIAVESQARQLADSTLQNNIDSVQTNVDNVSSALSSETLSREQLDIRLTENIETISNNLNSEISRAKSAENTLSDRCDTYDSHVANESNPHSVTAEQVGLGNVTNVATTDTITLNSEENVTSGAVYDALETKVDKVPGKGLSDQNFTYAEKTKLAGLENYDDASIKSRISANESAIITLNGDSSTIGSVDKKIADAIAGVTQIDFIIVTKLPSTGVKGVLYFVLDSSVAEKNTYNEYIWLNDSWELLGQTMSKIDLSEYAKTTVVQALVSVKNDKITISDNSTTLSDSEAFISGSAETNPTSLKRHSLSSLWTYISGKISSNISDIWDLIKTKFSITTLGNGNAVTNMSYNAGTFTVTKGSTFLTSHQDISGKQDKTLKTPISVDGVSKTTVESALSGINSRFPTLPTTDGEYYLKCTISNSSPTYSWVSLSQLLDITLEDLLYGKSSS